MFRFKHYTLLTREGWIYLALLMLLLIGALVRQINLLVVLYGMLAGPLLLSWGLSRRTIVGLVLKRHLPDSIPAGETFVVQLEAKNTRSRLSSWAVGVQDRIQREGPHSTGWKPQLLFNYLKAGESHRESYRGRLVRRGRYQFGPLGISTRFPFGLLKSSTSVELADAILVTPRTGRMTRAWRERLAQVLDADGRGKLKRRSREGDFFGLREWRSDDSPRAIHWRSSARRQKLIVRQHEQSRRQDVTIVLDLWQSEAAGTIEQESVELAVSFVATVLADLARLEGANVRLKVTGSAPLELTGSCSQGFVSTAHEQLATVEAHRNDELPAMLGKALDETRSGAAVVVVSTRPPRLHDPARFPAGWRLPRRVEPLSRTIEVDLSASDWKTYFEVD